MLKVFRDNLKRLSWALWVVILAMVVVIFVDFGAVNPAGGAPTDAAAWTASGDLKVTYGEFRREYQQLQSQFRQIYGEQFNSEMERQFGLPILALDRALQRKILALEAERAGLRISDQELRDFILNAPVFNDAEGNFIGQERYVSLLRQNGFTVEDFEATQREQLLVTKLQNVLAGNIYVSDEEVEKAYRGDVERANIRFLQLPYSRFASEVEVSEEDLAAYFAEHQEEFRLPERRVVGYLLVDAFQLRDEIEIDEARLREYYDSHNDEFTQEEGVRARHILLQTNEERTVEQAEAELRAARERIEGGVEFAAVAREISEDPGSRDRGGDLGFFGRGRMVKEFEDAAFAAEPGTVVGPVRSPFGVHLIEVVEHRPGGVRPFEEARNIIRNRLLSEEAQNTAEQRAAEILARLGSGEGEIGAAEIEAAAEGSEAVTYNVTEPFGRQDPVPGIGRAVPFIEAAFELQAGELSEPVKVPRGWALLHLEEIQDPRLPELEEVEGQVRRALLDVRQRELAEERLEQARGALSEGSKTLDEVARELGVTARESGEFGRGQPIAGLGNLPEVNEAALALEQGQVGGPVSGPQSAVLFEVTERKHFDAGEFQRRGDEIRQRLEADRSTRLLASIVEERRREMNVQYAGEIVESAQAEGAQEQRQL